MNSVVLSSALFFGSRRADHEHGNIAQHLVYRRASGEVADRLGEALKDRAVGIGMTEDLDQLDTDIAGVEVREDQDVGLARHFTLTLHLVLRNCRNDRGIQLELAVALDIRAKLVNLLHRVDHYVNCLVLRASQGRECEQRDSGLYPSRSRTVSAEEIAIPASASASG